METEQKAAQQAPAGQAPEQFCKHCGGKLPADAVVCTLCGRQVEQMAQSGAPNIVINNANQNTNSNVNAYVAAKARNKWVALCLCLFLGVFGAHKFYEGKAGLGVLYLFTGGLLGIGAVIDFITILFKPNPYFV